MDEGSLTKLERASHGNEKEFSVWVRTCSSQVKHIFLEPT